MDYTIRVDTAMWGDAIPLAYIARAMATHAACSHGNQPFHELTFQNVYPRHVSRLLDAAKGGKLSVCDYDGRIAGAQELIDTSQMLPVANDDGPNANDIFALYVKRRHLSEWAGIEGDSFNFIDAPSEPIVFDLKNERGEVIKAGYFRGFVGSVASLPVPTAAAQLLSTPKAAPAIKPESPGAPVSDGGENAKAWIAKSIELANAIALRKWNDGERQLTARKICGAVAIELAKGEPGNTQKYHGTQGPRAADAVRSVALKRWKFIYPME